MRLAHPRHIGRGYTAIEFPTAVLLKREHVQRNAHSGMRELTTEVDMWCRLNLRADWRCKGIRVADHDIRPYGHHVFGIEFDDPVDMLMFEMRWGSQPTG